MSGTEARRERRILSSIVRQLQMSETTSIYRKPIQDHGGNKYLRTIQPADGAGEPIKVDVYAVLAAFGVTCPGRQQAVKKLLCAGLRGKGSQLDDLRGAMDALWRALDIQESAEKV